VLCHALEKKCICTKILKNKWYLSDIFKNQQVKVCYRYWKKEEKPKSTWKP